MSDQNHYNNIQSLNDIVWAETKTSKMICRGCLSETEMAHVVTTPHVLRNRPDASFFRCDVCGSLCCDLTDFTDYDEDDAFSESEMWMRHYLQSGAGIDSMIRPLQRMGITPDMRLVDVGCGVGFTVCFWNWAGGQGHGVEPSAYGRLGSKILDDKIIAEYLSDVPHLSNGSFERVFSSEVIEHVDDPKSFLDELRGVLSDDGAVVLTTPNADYIQPHSPISTLVAALSPGLHRVLFSRSALEDLLKGAGFAYVDVQAKDERLFAIASNQPFELKADPEAEREQYLSFLHATADRSTEQDLKSGLLFRAFKEEVNSERFGDAESTADALIETIRDQYKLDLRDIAACLERARRIDSFEEFGAQMPYFTPVLLFYLGMAALQGVPVKVDAEAAFAACCELGEIGHALVPSLFQEAHSVYSLAALHRGIALLRSEEREAAIEVLNHLVDASEDGVFAPSEHLRLRALREKGVAVLQSGEPENAMKIFRLVFERAPWMSEDALDLYRVAKTQSQERIDYFLESRSNAD